MNNVTFFCLTFKSSKLKHKSLTKPPVDVFKVKASCLARGEPGQLCASALHACLQMKKTTLLNDVLETQKNLHFILNDIE